MCGLAGIFHPSGAGSVDAALLRRMTTSLRHRGPDGEGFHLEPGIGLGHRRLAIIDPAGGEQPMFNEDLSVAITFNGEIYNAADLRPELEALGHRFRSRCDTEAIIHAWESFGPACLDRLTGQFAFAIWDRNRRTLFLARDHFGKKPLYYATDRAGRCVFASELSALAEVAALSRTPDPAAIEDFFTFGYVPDPASIFREIRKLPPAHCLEWRAGEAMPAPRRYWQVPLQRIALPETEATTQLIELLSAATARRLVSDVPLGAFLSGGVDSSAVVAFAARARTTPLDTFTMGFDGAEDETPYAAAVAARYGTRQHNARAAAIDLIDAARTMGKVFGEPFGDISAPPTHAVCALARRHATVALSGDGGDEVFAGYRRYRWHLLVEAARRYLPAPVRRSAIAGLARLYPKLDRAPQFLRAKHTLTELSLDTARGFAATVTKMQTQQRRALFAPRAARGARRPRPGRALRRAARRSRSCRAAGAGAVHGPAHLAARRHPGQSRSRQHGELAGGARAVPRPRAGRLRPRPEDGAENRARRGQVRAEVAHSRRICRTICCTGRNRALPVRRPRCSAPRRRGCARGCSGRRWAIAACSSPPPSPA